MHSDVLAAPSACAYDDARRGAVLEVQLEQQGGALLSKTIPNDTVRALMLHVVCAFGNAVVSTVEREHDEEGTR